MILEIFASTFISFSAADIVTAQQQNYVEQNAPASRTGLIYSLDDSWRLPEQEPNTDLLVKHKPRTILIHHTGTPQTRGSIVTKLQKLYNYSIKRDGKKEPWGDVPYHFYIDKNGNMMAGRPVQFEPDTKTNFDPTGYLNITVEGNYTDAGGDTFSSSQKSTLKKLIADLKAKYKIKSVMRHSDVAQTECPGHVHP